MTKYEIGVSSGGAFKVIHDDSVISLPLEVESALRNNDLLEVNTITNKKVYIAPKHITYISNQEGIKYEL